MTAKCVVVLVTCPNRRTASTLAQRVVKARLAACVNSIPGIESHFWWGGKIDRGRESLLLIKTTASRFEPLRRFLLRHHPYDVPEIVALPIVAAHRPYTAWVAQSVRSA